MALKLLRKIGAKLELDITTGRRSASGPGPERGKFWEV